MGGRRVNGGHWRGRIASAATRALAFVVAVALVLLATACSSASLTDLSGATGSWGQGQEQDGSGEQDQASTPSYTTWSEDESPNYVRLVGEAQVEEPLEPGEVVYSDLDAIGRTGQVRACITSEMMEEGKARERGEMPDPSGWPEENFEADIEMPDGHTYHGWFWNRSHLLAKSLGGDERRTNLVTATRTQNVGANDGQGGMDMFETAIRSWLEAYPDVTVQYVATPVYEGDEPICRSVFVDVLSSDGALNERLEVYNAAKGYSIDYSTGEVTAI